MLIPFPQLIKRYNINPVGVLHIGANDGAECEAYYANGVQQTIWIEAIESVFYKLCDNISKYPNVQAFNICVDEITGREVIFNISSNGGESSSIFEFGIHKTLHPDVTFVDKVKMTTTRIDAIFKDLAGFDFLNIDIQGNELSALKSMGTLLNGFKYAYLEVNKKSTYKNIPLFPEVCKFMRDNGFELVESKWVKDRYGEDCWGDSFWLKILIEKIC